MASSGWPGWVRSGDDPLRAGGFGGIGAAGRDGPGEQEAERRADADLALDAERAAVDPGDPLADREPQPEAAGRARADLVDAVEPLEEARQVLGGDAAAG